MRIEVVDVSVDPTDDVTFANKERSPQDVALTAAGRNAGKDFGNANDPGPRARGSFGRAIFGSIIEHDHLIDDVMGEDEVAHQRGGGVADCCLLISGRQTDRYRQSRPALGGGELAKGEVAMVVGRSKRDGLLA